QQRQAIQLSQMLYRERIAQAAHVRDSYKFAQFMQLLIIGIGFVTTLVVGLSSSYFGQGESTRALFFRAAAIVLPVLGTAVASVSAYYSPSLEVGQAKATLASLAQLHSQIALEVWSTNCVPDKIDKLSTQWVRRYQEIQVLSAAAPQAKSGEGSSTS